MEIIARTFDTRNRRSVCSHIDICAIFNNSLGDFSRGLSENSSWDVSGESSRGANRNCSWDFKRNSAKDSSEIPLAIPSGTPSGFSLETCLLTHPGVSSMVSPGTPSQILTGISPGIPIVISSEILVEFS